MLTRILAAGALAALTATAAQAGVLQNGTWTANCPSPPGDAPEISSKSADAYNKSAKAVQAWQTNAKAYVECMTTEAKADQTAIVSSVNAVVQKVNDQSSGLKAQSDAAIEKLKSKK